MKINCPYCRKEIDFMEVQSDKDIIAIIMMSAGFGKHTHLVWAYVELFGVTPMRGKTKKIRLILEEMKGLFDSQAFKYQKRKYEISHAGISEALNVVVHHHFETHLDSHNYLKKIMIGISEREARESGKIAEKDLRKKETGMSVRRADDPFLENEKSPLDPPFIKGGSGGFTKGESGGFEDRKNLTPAQIEENKKRIKELYRTIGE
jgi:hypothetical protein